MNENAKKKLFISVPIRNRSEEDIIRSMTRMKVFAEALWGQDFDVLSTFFDESAPEGTNIPVWYLGKSILKLAEADYFIGIEHYFGKDHSKYHHYSGCEIEATVAHLYGIPMYLIDQYVICPDTKKEDGGYDE